VRIRTAANEQEIEQAAEVCWANDPPSDASDKDGLLTHWLATYASSPEGFWLAEDEPRQQIVGVASAVRRPPQWLLTNFFVLPTYHGQGVGQALLTQAFATHEGCDRFTVHASLHSSAQSLYLRFGMYPQPYSIYFKGIPQNQSGSPSPVTAEEQPLSEIISVLNALDQEMLGFERVVDHERWAKHGCYYLVKAGKGQVVGYFHVSPERSIGPVVVTDRQWMPAALALALRTQSELWPGEQELLVPGANTSTLAYLLSHGYRYRETEMLLSSHPMPGLAQVVFHDVDFL